MKIKNILALAALVLPMTASDTMYSSEKRRLLIASYSTKTVIKYWLSKYLKR